MRKMNILLIAIIALFTISTPAYSEDIPECNLDESMCPDCGTLTGAKVTGTYNGYGTGPSLECEYELGTDPGEKYPNTVTFYYRCFKTEEEAAIWTDYYKNERKDGPPPFCKTACELFGRYSSHCVSTGSSMGCWGNYYTAKNIAANMNMDIRGTDTTKEQVLERIEELASCQKNLKEPPAFKGEELTLNIDSHPLKNIIVKINSNTYTTDDDGTVEIPTDGESTIIFTNYKQKEHFSIYVRGEVKPLELTLKTKNSVITEITIDSGTETITKEASIPIKDFSFDTMIEEVYATAKRYIHMTEALEFYQNLNIEFTKPVKIITFIDTDKEAAYYDYKIIIDDRLSDSEDSWNPFVDYHEFSHYAMNQLYGDEYYKELLKSPNHGGFANPTTTDSWIEGFAAYMSTTIANHYDRWWAEKPFEKRLSFYPMAGSLDANYKAWEHEGKAEEYAIAAFLYDLTDTSHYDSDRTFLAQYLYIIYFINWDIDHDKTITKEELYLGNLRDSYAKSFEQDHITWYFMIEMGKDMEDYFENQPDMEIFTNYDSDNNGILNQEELEKMSEILNDDGSLMSYEWLKYYDNNSDQEISKQEAEHLLKGYSIIMEVSNGKEESGVEDIREWTKDERIQRYIDKHTTANIEKDMTYEDFIDLVMEKISESDDDEFEYSFEYLWENTLKNKHKDFTSVLGSLETPDRETEQKLENLAIQHGMYQRATPGDGQYNPGEAYQDTNNNKEKDETEDYIDYPFSWEIEEGDAYGAPSNYQRLGRESTPRFSGNYIKTGAGTYDILYLIKDGMKIIDIVSYSATADDNNKLYIPIPGESTITISKVSDEENNEYEHMATFTSGYIEENYETIRTQGYIAEIGTNSNSRTYIIAIAAIVLAIIIMASSKKRKPSGQKNNSHNKPEKDKEKNTENKNRKDAGETKAKNSTNHA